MLKSLYLGNLTLHSKEIHFFWVTCTVLIYAAQGKGLVATAEDAAEELLVVTSTKGGSGLV